MSINSVIVTADTIAEKTKEKTQKIEKKTIKKKTVNEYDLDLLARAITAEAGSEVCTYEMRLYVGSVIINRIKSDLFPDTLEGVIYQQGQFQCVDNGMINNPAYEEPKAIAEKLLTTGSALPEDVLFFAEFTQGSGIYTRLQNIYFCYR